MLLKIRFVMVKEYLHSNRTPSNNLTCLNKYMVKNIWCLCGNCYRVKASTRFSVLLAIFHWVHIEKDPCPMRAMTLGPSSSVHLLPACPSVFTLGCSPIIWSFQFSALRAAFGALRLMTNLTSFVCPAFTWPSFIQTMSIVYEGQKMGENFPCLVPGPLGFLVLSQQLDIIVNLLVEDLLNLHWDHIPRTKTFLIKEEPRECAVREGHTQLELRSFLCPCRAG